MRQRRRPVGHKQLPPYLQQAQPHEGSEDTTARVFRAGETARDLDIAPLVRFAEMNKTEAT